MQEFRSIWNFTNNNKGKIKGIVLLANFFNSKHKTKQNKSPLQIFTSFNIWRREINFWTAPNKNLYFYDGKPPKLQKLENSLVFEKLLRNQILPNARLPWQKFFLLKAVIKKTIFF